MAHDMTRGMAHDMPRGMAHDMTRGMAHDMTRGMAYDMPRGMGRSDLCDRKRWSAGTGRRWPSAGAGEHVTWQG